MCYSRRAVVFALFLSFLQPAISQEICSPGTGHAPALATLSCKSDGPGACPSACTPVEGEASGIISDNPGNYSNSATCWWLITTTSPGATIQISFQSFTTRLGDFVSLYNCKTSGCLSERILKAEGSLGSIDTYYSTTGSLKMWFASDTSSTETGFTAVSF
jgi:hypothetical protein